MLWSDFEFFDPWQEFDRMRRAFRASALSSGEFPAVNVWTSSDDAIVTTELPGVDPSSIDISVTGNTLNFKGSRVPEELSEEESYHRRERWYGQFSKSVVLPFNVEADKVNAKFQKGILQIELPRAEAEKPRKIQIQA